MNISFPERLSSVRKKLGLSQRKLADRMGMSLSYLHKLEKGERPPSDSVESLVRILETQIEGGLIEGIPLESDSAQADSPDSTQAQGAYRAGKTFRRKIPVLGWVHAGQAPSYEQLPDHWHDEISTDCKDPHAFGLCLEGVSMAERFEEGDILTVMPSMTPHSGCYVVCRFTEHGGVLFRQLEIAKEVLRLIPLNKRYPVEEFEAKDFSWIYPVFEARAPLWKGC